MLPDTFRPPLWFRVAYSAMVLPLALGGLDAIADDGYSLLRRFAAFVFVLVVAWLLASIWTTSVVIAEDALEVRRLWPARSRHAWTKVKECRHGTVLSFVVLRDGRWIALGWIDHPGQMQVRIEQSIVPLG